MDDLWGMERPAAGEDAEQVGDVPSHLLAGEMTPEEALELARLRRVERWLAVAPERRAALRLALVAASAVRPAGAHTYARAAARAASMATLERGWHEFLARGRERVTMGGPVPAEAIVEALEVIAWCQRAGVAAPSVYPAPRADMTSGLSLEWDRPDVWAEWLAPGVWEIVAPGHDSWSASVADVCAALEALR